MSLLDSEIGRSYVVDYVEMQGNTLRRLQALGLIAGTSIKVLNRKKSGSVIFHVRGTRLAVGRKIARSVKVHLAEAQNGGYDG